MKKELTIINQFFPPDYAATGQLLFELSNFLKENGYKVYVFTTSNKYAFGNQNFSGEESIYQENIKRSKLSNFWPKKFYGRIINSLIFCLSSTLKIISQKSKNSLVIITTEPPFMALFIALIYKVFKINYIYIIYDLYPDVITKQKLLNKNNIIIKIWRFLNNQAIKNSKKAVVLSSDIKNMIIKSKYIQKDKIQIIPSWADHKKIKPIKKNKNKFCIKNNLVNKFVILYSGNQGKFHDLKTILKSAKYLYRNNYCKNIVFLFIGNGKQNASLKDYSKKNNLKNCIFLPYQKYCDLGETLTSADIALISINSMASGVVAPSKLYGHLAAGTSIGIISPSNSYLKDIVENAKCGKWFDNGDYKSLAKWILSMKIEKNKCTELGRNSRKYLIKKASREKILKVYERLIFSFI